MGAPTKRARKVRTEAEFDVRRLSSALVTPKGGGFPLTSWTLAEIFSARDAQLRGDFRLPARMAESMRTDDALAVAFENRLAPQRCIKVEMVAAPKARGKSIADEGDALFGQNGVGIRPNTAASIHACLVNHDVAFATNTASTRDDGSRIDFVVRAWPIEFVRWDGDEGCFKARVASGTGIRSLGSAYDEVPITHGDGRWVVFQRYDHDPFKHAAILAAAVVWARHAYAIRDWSKGSVAHGSAKVIGALPEGVPLQSADGTLSAEATAMAELLRGIATSDAPVGIKPAGSTVDFLTNNSTAWQVWEKLVENAEKAAARIYLGTDGTLGSQGGAPGIDIESLFGVASTKVQGDLAAIERGILTGVIEPWCAMNFGDSTLAPTRRYILPDPDADAERASVGTRRAAFFADIEAARAGKFVIDQRYVDSVANEYGIEPPELIELPPVPTDVVPSAEVPAAPALRLVP